MGKRMTRSSAEYSWHQLLRKVAAYDSVLVVHGPNSFIASGASGNIARNVRKPKKMFLSTPGGDPMLDNIRCLMGKIENIEWDAILAVGGGSTIDTAKILKAFMGRSEISSQMLKDPDQIVPNQVPLYVLPTLVGSGSEVTHFAVIYDGMIKCSIAHDRLRPDGFAYNATYVRRAPGLALAASALDALCQAIESFWSINSTEESRGLAGRAIELLFRCMTAAVVERTLPEIEMLQRGANLAGRAIDLTKTTAPHSVSYALTSRYAVPHGHAVALLLPVFFGFNDGVEDSDCLDSRGVEFVRNRLRDLRSLLNVSTNADVSDFFTALLVEFGLATSLEAIGIVSDADAQSIVDNGFNPQRVNNNPRRLTPDLLRTLLSSNSSEIAGTADA